MKTLPFKNYFFGLAGLLALASCNNEDEDIMEGSAQVNIALIDAPADYDEVWIEVLGVEILTNDENENDDSAWISIPNEADEDKLNLLSLVGGNEAFIGSEEVPAGEIAQIRLLLGDDNYLVMDGEEIPLTTPSAQQSGLKLKLNQELMAGIQYDLVIDFDAAKSIVEAGNSGQYILKPVLRVVAEESASIEGQVLPLEAKSTVYGIIGEDTVSTYTDDIGAYALRGLITGEYTIIIDPIEGYEPDTLFSVSAVEGEVTILDPIELEETSAEIEVEINN
ncbi:DUF4382 domain-containing protein [Echinicola sp. CAU 1574]|uniref:DUF4382 domain-containing protein n=1 Tax=Echinicola arenosa TaxID=2774144 RepID=A0ABR9AQR7_9BACT|nr:DUF4382 domain-containing protein [Echinicola arenosa]MBD8491131.1 DUF4382 domain-containing protein [Echinicola arenosa]